MRKVTNPFAASCLSPDMLIPLPPQAPPLMRMQQSVAYMSVPYPVRTVVTCCDGVQTQCCDATEPMSMALKQR